MSLYAMWVHGNNVQLERIGATNVTGKQSVHKAFADRSGDTVTLGGYGAVACLRTGSAARFVVFDAGDKNFAKSGNFWVHYAIPTPVIVNNNRAKAVTVLVKFGSSDSQALSIAAVHVWDGNARIFRDDEPDTTSGSDYRGALDGRDIYLGIGVSIRIRAHEAKDDYLEIHGVGVDFQIGD